MRYSITFVGVDEIIQGLTLNQSTEIGRRGMIMSI